MILRIIWVFYQNPGFLNHIRDILFYFTFITLPNFLFLVAVCQHVCARCLNSGSSNRWKREKLNCVLKCHIEKMFFSWLQSHKNIDTVNHHVSVKGNSFFSFWSLTLFGDVAESRESTRENDPESERFATKRSIMWYLFLPFTRDTTSGAHCSYLPEN